MLRVRNLEAGYGKLRVLRGVSLHVDAGEVVIIIGANGAGKSTLLKTVAGVLRPRDGAIEFLDQGMHGQMAETVVARGCVLVPEGRQLFGTLTVRENLILGAYLQARKGRRKALQERLQGVYDLFPRLQERGEQLAGTLSGGEQQMVAIGRALMARPRLIMMDEPSMGLAPLVVEKIFETIARLPALGITVLLVEQNARASLGIASRGYVLETGRMVLSGTCEELLDNHDVQRAYLGKDYRTIAERSVGEQGRPKAEAGGAPPMA
ncbi:MAG: ABC transporter ATP-binding protein [Spirochaetales bacterium]|nr:ABC transporter ATP-binding protein [Spirochaetales bacterium]